VMSEGQLIAGDWWAVIFNPSFPYRFIHMLLASGLTASFLVAGLSAWRLMKAPADTAADKTLRVGVFCAALIAPIQIFAGDLHGLNTLEHQPAKIAAMEALWHTKIGAPLVLFALPNEKTRQNDYALELQRGASVILKHSPDAEIKGLNEFAPDIPPVQRVFFAFRVMVGMGVLMLLLSWGGALKLRQGAPPTRWLLRLLAAFSFSGWIAVLAGWIVSESGRQPWLVTGVLRTAEAAGKASKAQLGVSLTAYVITYAIILLAYIVVLTHLAGSGADAKASRSVPGYSS
jgi:cytochrome d ubiquinol oxidase subunit I